LTFPETYGFLNSEPIEAWLNNTAKEIADLIISHSRRRIGNVTAEKELKGVHCG
jgi:hypothetical protein